MRQIKERKIGDEIIEEMLDNPELLFYDLMERTIVAAAKIKIDTILTNLVVVFTKEIEKIKIITTYLCKNIDKEIERGDEIR